MVDGPGKGFGVYSGRTEKRRGVARPAEAEKVICSIRNEPNSKIDIIQTEKAPEEKIGAFLLREWTLHPDGLSDVNTVRLEFHEVTGMLNFFFDLLGIGKDKNKPQ